MLIGDLHKGKASPDDQIIYGKCHSSLASLETRVKLETETGG